MEFSKNELPIKYLLKEMSRFNANNELIPFSVIAITCNYAKNEGGRVIVLENVIEAKSVRHLKHARFGYSKRELPSSIDSVRPALANRVRRLYLLDNGEIRNVNIRYITHFKGLTDTAFRRVVY